MVELYLRYLNNYNFPWIIYSIKKTIIFMTYAYRHMEWKVSRDIFPIFAAAVYPLFRFNCPRRGIYGSPVVYSNQWYGKCFWLYMNRNQYSAAVLTCPTENVLKINTHKSSGHSTLTGSWLTHWGRDKMAVTLQMAFSNAFSWMKM